MTNAIVFHGDLEAITRGNDRYRRVLFTGDSMQLVVMSVRPGESIPLEVHDDHDQFLRVDGGHGTLRVRRARSSRVVEYPLRDGTAALIPAGVYHEVLNASKTRPLQLYSLYSPPEHPHGLVQARMPSPASETRPQQGRTSQAKPKPNNIIKQREKI